MRRLPPLAAIAAALAFALAGPALAIDLPPTEEGVYVYDLADIWSQSARDHANVEIGEIRDRTQAQIVVVSWPSGYSSVDTELARVDAHTIMDTWGIGRAGVNDGLVILFDMDETLAHGQIYLYTGNGFADSYLTDEEAAEIVDGTMLPRAKDGDLDAAMLDGLAKVDAIVQPGGNPDRLGRNAMRLAVGGLVTGGGLLMLALFLRTWWLRGRDARIPTIDDSVLLPAPPPDLTPALAAVLRKDGIDNETFTSALVDLGHRGLLTFAQDPDNDKHVDLVVPPEASPDPAAADARRRPLGHAEKTLIGDIRRRAVVEDGDGRLMLSSAELRKGEGAKLFSAFKSSMGSAAKASGWFRDDPTKLTGRWAGIGGAVLGAAGVLLFLAFDKSESNRLLAPGMEFLGIPMLAVAGAGVAILVLQRFLAARTESGAQTLAMALAYRNTLRYEIAQAQTMSQAVERTTSRLPWITTPDELTVWAVALGLKDEVSKLIEETFRQDPTGGGWSPIWFSGTNGFSSLGSVSSMLSSVSTTAASSSGGGYGGGSGGGGGGAGGGF